MDKTSDEIINKTFVEYKQRDLIEKGEKTAKTLGKHAVNLYSSGISRFIKIRDVRKLQQDTEDESIIKDQMAALGCLLVYTFGDYLALILAAVHTINNVDFGGESEDEGYEGEAISIVHKI